MGISVDIVRGQRKAAGDVRQNSQQDCEKPFHSTLREIGRVNSTVVSFERGFRSFTTERVLI